MKAGKLILLDINHTERHPRFSRRADADRARLSQLRRAGAGSRSTRPPARPRTIVAKLNAKVVEIARTRRDEGEDALDQRRSCRSRRPQEMAKYLIEDTARNAEVIRIANIKLE